jgi:hypothetical protein
VLELGEHKGGSGYLGGAAGVGGDVLEGGPALRDSSKSVLRCVNDRGV